MGAREKSVILDSDMPRVAWLALITIAGICLYVLIDAVLDFLPPYYSLVRQPESDYAVGPYGFLMDANFVIRGLFSFALLVGLYKGTRAAGRSRLGLLLLGVWAVGALLLAVFPTTIDVARPTATGSIHGAVAFVAFSSVAVAEVLISLRFGGDERWRPLRLPAIVTGVATLAAFAAFLGTMAATIATAYGADIPFGNVVGLSERIFLGLVLLWMFVMALQLRSIVAREVTG